MVNWSVVITPAAEDDLRDIADWYEEKQKGLGTKFLDRLKAAGESISQHPKSFRVVKDHIRAIRLKDFPYTVYYVIELQKIVILAVIHARRAPSTIDILLDR